MHLLSQHAEERVLQRIVDLRAGCVEQVHADLVARHGQRLGPLNEAAQLEEVKGAGEAADALLECRVGQLDGPARLQMQQQR